MMKLLYLLRIVLHTKSDLFTNTPLQAVGRHWTAPVDQIQPKTQSVGRPDEVVIAEGSLSE